MNTDTQNKMNELFKSFNASKPQAEVKTYKSLPEIEQAAKSSQVISLYNLSELVNENPKVESQPVSKIDAFEVVVVDDGPTGYPEETTAPKLQYVDYSDKAFALIGDTKDVKIRLRDLGGRYNPFLKCGKGWIFPKSKESQIRQELSAMIA